MKLNTLKSWVSILLLTVAIPESYAQFLSLKGAERLATNSSWYVAIPKLSKTWKKTKDPQIARMVADSYLSITQFDSAASWYARMQPGILRDSMASKNYIKSLLALGQYKQAKILMKDYLRVYPIGVETKVLLKSCDAPLVFSDNSALVILENQASNSRNHDFSPVWKDGKLQFCSSRRLAVRSYDGDGKPFLRIFQSEKASEDDAMKGAKQISVGKSTRYHIGPFAYDSSRIILTANTNNGTEAGRYTQKIALLNLYYANPKGESDYRMGEPFEYNIEKYSTGHPAISPNGKYLLFISDRPGTIGGTDLYLCKREGNKWGQPSNLGPLVNTYGNEMFPTFSGDSLVFFSTNGRAGFGGLDLFKADFDEGKLSNIENIGQPYNSSRDDFGLIYVSKGEGFLSSNRRGGKGLDDIYRFRNKAIKVNLIAINASKNKPVSLATVRVTAGKDFLGQKQTDTAGHILIDVLSTKPVTVFASKAGLKPARQTYNLDFRRTRDTTIYIYMYEGLTSEISGYVMDEQRNVLDQATVVLTDTALGDYQVAETGPDGYFFFIVEPSKSINLSGAKPGYFTQFRKVPQVKAGDKLVRQDLILPQIMINKALALEPIYYDFDKWDLRPESVNTLEKVYRIMMENPTVLIECSSHTDMRGTNEYNDNLSVKRALVVMDYLVARGIPLERLTYKVYGEVKPAIPCPKEYDCNEARHQMNRRTEFRVLYF